MRLILVIAFLFTISSFSSEDGVYNVMDSAQKVSIKKVDNRYTFLVQGKKFDIRGVGINFDDGHDYKALKRINGNAFRTWSTKHAETELKEAKKHGFMVALGVDMGKELHGFDYEDGQAVATQLEDIKRQIDQFKHHPNLLCWVVGNELNLLFDDEGKLKQVNPKVYSALADIVDYIHETDPNHPVTTTFAGVNKNHMETALKYCPELDFISVQVYGDLENVEDLMKASEIEKPYLVTEFGPVGFWEKPTTTWGREIEEASGPKADGIIYRYEKGILQNKSGNCLGGFAFEWGQKQERTPTWFGMFYEDGSHSETIDHFERIWTGKEPVNSAPRVDKMELNEQIATDNITIESKGTIKTSVRASDRNGDDLFYTYILYKEVETRSLGGAFEQEPVSEVLLKKQKDKNEFQFKAPEEKGEYRILVYVHDMKGKAGTANIPFLVK